MKQIHCIAVLGDCTVWGVLNSRNHDVLWVDLQHGHFRNQWKVAVSARLPWSTQSEPTCEESQVCTSLWFWEESECSPHLLHCDTVLVWTLLVVLMHGFVLISYYFYSSCKFHTQTHIQILSPGNHQINNNNNHCGCKTKLLYSETRQVLSQRWIL
jgi:hypothetical protein